MPLVTLLQALARISVFMEYASFFPPNICSSSILTIHGHQTALTCRHDEAFLPQRKTWWSGARVGSFGSSLLSSGSTRRTPSTLALLPSEGPQSMHAALQKRACMYFAFSRVPQNHDLFPREGNCMSLKSCYPYFKIPTLAMSDTWVMGLYDTCSYDGPTGRTVSALP